MRASEAGLATPPIVPRSAPLLRVRNLSIEVETARGAAEAVRGVNLELSRGGALGVVGESGSGKTLTCRAILGVLAEGCTVSTGTIELGGDDLLSDGMGWSGVRGTRIGAVFQDPGSYLNPSIAVGEQVAEVLRVRGGRRRRDARERARELLGLMRLRNPDRVYRQLPGELSGGMLQRLLLAIAVSCEPELLVADEATASLDLRTQYEIVELLLELRAELDLAILFVSHDLAGVTELCDDVAVFYAGEIVEAGPIGEVVVAPAHPYTEALLRVDGLGGDGGGALEVIPGQHPQLGAMPPGCRFAPRCAHAADACRRAPIGIGAAGPGRTVRCARAAELSLGGALRR